MDSESGASVRGLPEVAHLKNSAVRTEPCVGLSISCSFYYITLSTRAGIGIREGFTTAKMPKQPKYLLADK